MEELGIGRPSTYAQTLQTLKGRDYISLEKKSLVPTSQGILTSDTLDKHFNEIINVKYTAEMEDNLDKIAKGEISELNELKNFYSSFEPLFEEAKNNMDKLQPKLLDETCPKCGSPLCVRISRFKKEFIGCSNYPKCKYIKADETENQDEDTNIICPKCGTGHILKKIAKTGSNKGNAFYSCSNFPKCKNIYSDMPTSETCPNCNAIMLQREDGTKYCSAHCENDTNIICPKCGKGHIVKKVATRGKNKGNIFYSCSNFPRCKVIFESLDNIKE